MSEIPVITIDGPSGTGKGTIANLVAKELSWHLLDSGALYRVLAYGSLKNGIKPNNNNKICEFSKVMHVVFSRQFEGSIELNNEEISTQIRTEETAELASVIAALPEVREALLKRQRDFRKPPGLVADGRDMGTVVFPDAAVKIFLTASAEERAQRRYKQLINKGVGVNLRALLQDIEARDARDANRSASPLVPANDAHVIDTTSLTVEQVLAIVLSDVQNASLQ